MYRSHFKAESSIFLDGRNIESYSRQEIARTIGYVPQSSTSSLSTTVFDTVLMGRRPHITWKVSDTDIGKVADTLELLNLQELSMRDFSQLSGGQKQKVLIARALAQEPSVLLLDEPTTNLDLRHQLEVMEIVSSMVHKKKLSAVMAIHDINLAARFSDKLAMLFKGRIYANGPAGLLLSAKNMAYVFGIEALIMNVSGRPYVVPISSINGTPNSTAAIAPG